MFSAPARQPSTQHPALAFLGETKPLQLGDSQLFVSAAAVWAPLWDLGGSLWLLSPLHGVQPFPASVYPPVSRARSVPAELMLQAVVI